MKRYERLEAWHAAHQLVLLTYRVTKSFPREELYGLTSQLAYIFQLVKDLELIEPTKWSELDQDRERAGRLTWGLYRSVRTIAFR